MIKKRKKEREYIKELFNAIVNYSFCLMNFTDGGIRKKNGWITGKLLQKEQRYGILLGAEAKVGLFFLFLWLQVAIKNCSCNKVYACESGYMWMYMQEAEKSEGQTQGYFALSCCYFCVKKLSYTQQALLKFSSVASRLWLLLCLWKIPHKYLLVYVWMDLCWLYYNILSSDFFLNYICRVL